MKIGIIASAGVLVLVVLWILTRSIVGESRLQVTGTGVFFPTVSGFNLDREELEFHRDFAGSLNLVIVPFEQRQQLDVNNWIPAAQALEREFPGFIYYELPTIYQLPSLSRTFINEGMRAGIPDQTSRERTVTLYLDKETFKASLGIESEAVIHLFLCDAEGRILWRTTGVYSAAKDAELREVIRTYHAAE